MRMTDAIAPFPYARVPECMVISTSRLLVMRDVAGGPIASAPEETRARRSRGSCSVGL
jgi:hypothetical protein